MKKDLLQIEVDLLLLKYGESAVIKSLSSSIYKSEDEIIEKIRSLKDRKSRAVTKTRNKKRPIDIANEVIAGSKNENLLVELAILYQNKQFLPQLKDVKRFLGRFNINKNIRSRNDATRAVFESLTQCSLAELNELMSSSGTDSQSSFATLAEHIMGDGGHNSSNK